MRFTTRTPPRCQPGWLNLAQYRRASKYPQPLKSLRPRNTCNCMDNHKDEEECRRSRKTHPIVGRHDVLLAKNGEHDSFMKFSTTNIKNPSYAKAHLSVTVHSVASVLVRFRAHDHPPTDAATGATTETVRLGPKLTHRQSRCVLLDHIKRMDHVELCGCVLPTRVPGKENGHVEHASVQNNPDISLFSCASQLLPSCSLHSSRMQAQSSSCLRMIRRPTGTPPLSQRDHLRAPPTMSLSPCRQTCTWHAPILPRARKPHNPDEKFNPICCSRGRLPQPLLLTTNQVPKQLTFPSISSAKHRRRRLGIQCVRNE